MVRAATVENSLVVFQQAHPELPCDLAMPPLDTYPKELKEALGTCTTMATAMLTTSAKRQKELKGSSREEWINKNAVFPQWSI
jgi:hypothetical protein